MVDGVHIDCEIVEEEDHSSVSVFSDGPRAVVASFPKCDDSQGYVNLTLTLTAQVCRALNLGMPKSVLRSLVAALEQMPETELPKGYHLLVASNENRDAVFKVGDRYLDIRDGDFAVMRTSEEMIRMLKTEFLDQAGDELDDIFS